MRNPAIRSIAANACASPKHTRHRVQFSALLVVTPVCLLFAPLSTAQRVQPTAAEEAKYAYHVLPGNPTGMNAGDILPSSGMTSPPGAGRDRAIVAPGTLPEAARSDKYIAPRQPAPRLSSKDKALLGLKDAGSVNTVLAATVAAGISHADNSIPNYGDNSSAYAQRFGAAMARSASYSIFSDSVMASVLHEDPRYYRLGKEHKFVTRLGYAVTRPLISRTDGGHLTPNFSLVTGHLGAAYLTRVYYPQQNRSTDAVLETFGFSFIGSAIVDGVNEFLSGKLNILHNSRGLKD